jgi:hypothetical protein
MKMKKMTAVMMALLAVSIVGSRGYAQNSNDKIAVLKNVINAHANDDDLIAINGANICVDRKTNFSRKDNASFDILVGIQLRPGGQCKTGVLVILSLGQMNQDCQKAAHDPCLHELFERRGFPDIRRNPKQGAIRYEIVFNPLAGKAESLGDLEQNDAIVTDGDIMVALTLARLEAKSRKTAKETLLSYQAQLKGKPKAFDSK